MRKFLWWCGSAQDVNETEGLEFLSGSKTPKDSIMVTSHNLLDTTPSDAFCITATITMCNHDLLEFRTRAPLLLRLIGIRFLLNHSVFHALVISGSRTSFVDE